MGEELVIATLMINTKYLDKEHHLMNAYRLLFEDKLRNAVNMTDDTEIDEFIRDYPSLFENEDDTDISDAKVTLIDQIEDLFGTDFTQRRDFTWILPEKKYIIYLSGGLTNGDDPSEGFSMLCRIDEMSDLDKVSRVLDDMKTGKL